MRLFSFLSKKKQDSESGDGEFFSRAEEDSNALRGRGKRKSNQSNQPVDPVLPEKKRARRRLVGAVALVLAAIIGLPMILDSEQRPLVEDIAIQIPSKDKITQQSSIRSASPSRSQVSASDSLAASEEIIKPASAPAPAVTATAENKVSEKSGSTKQNVAAIAKESAEVKVEPKGDVKPDAKIDTKPVAKIDSKPVGKIPPAPAIVDEAARAKAILEGRPEIKTAVDKKEVNKKAADTKPKKFVLQVAALATQEKINELQGKLRNAGIQSYTQKVATESGMRTRIRVGPFASKEEADKVRAELIKMGLNGTLVQ